jgi:hypothetical protein
VRLKDDWYRAKYAVQDQSVDLVVMPKMVLCVLRPDRGVCAPPNNVYMIPETDVQYTLYQVRHPLVFGIQPFGKCARVD